MATVRRDGGAVPVVESCVTVAAPPPEQRARVAEFLGSAPARTGAIGSVLESADYELLLIEAPDVRPEEVKAATRWRLKDAIDFPLEEAVVDVFDIPEPIRRTGPKMIYAVAARRQAVDHHVSLLSTASRQLDVIDIPELALSNLATLLPEAADGLVLLWIKDESAQILVVKGGMLYLARPVRLDATRADDGGVDPFAMDRDVEVVALELQRSSDYLESHFEHPALTHLVVAPDDARAADFSRALAAETPLQIQRMNLARALELPAGLGPLDRRSVLAIGAALRSSAP